MVGSWTPLIPRLLRLACRAHCAPGARRCGAYTTLVTAVLGARHAVLRHRQFAGSAPALSCSETAHASRRLSPPSTSRSRRSWQVPSETVSSVC